METKRLTRDEAHAYWRQPNDGSNAPSDYINLADNPARAERSLALVELMGRLIGKDASILEIGCNAGRNLKFLHDAGYRRLSALEISQAAIDTMAANLPHIRAATEIRVGPAEDVIASFPPRSFDVVFTMAVLVHIPTESEWLFREIAERAASFLITIEHEKPTTSTRHYPRAYRSIFEAFGLSQIEEIHPFPGVPRAYFGRVFAQR